MNDRAENPYAPPASELDAEGKAPDRLTVVEEALVDYMSAMRPWVVLFAALCALAAAGCGWGVWTSLYGQSGQRGIAIGCGAAAIHLAVAVAALGRYVAAARIVARSRRRRDLEHALACRKLSNVVGFALLVGGIAFGTFAVSFWM